MSKQANLSILRTLIHELRTAFPKNTRLRELPIFQYILKEYRNNSLTDLQYCREKDELAFIALTFSTYLNSSRNLKRIQEEYHGRSERSIEETARMVGFKLPNAPR